MSETIELDSAKSKLLERIALAEHEYATGKYIDGPKVIASLKKKYLKED